MFFKKYLVLGHITRTNAYNRNVRANQIDSL